MKHEKNLLIKATVEWKENDHSNGFDVVEKKMDPVKMSGDNWNKIIIPAISKYISELDREFGNGRGIYIHSLEVSEIGKLVED